MKKPTITDVSWNCNVAMTRNEVQAMSKLGSYIGNIEEMMKTDFERSHREINWEHVRKIFRLFGSLHRDDKEFRTTVIKTLMEMRNAT